MGENAIPEISQEPAPVLVSRTELVTVPSRGTCPNSIDAGDTVFLTIRNGFDSICVDRKTGSYPVKVLSIEVGISAAQSASGAAEILYLPLLERSLHRASQKLDVVNVPA